MLLETPLSDPAITLRCLASTQRILDSHACFDFRRDRPRLGGYYTLLPSGTLVDRINRTRQPVHGSRKNSLEGISSADRQHLSNLKEDSPLNSVTSIIFPAHSTTKIRNPQSQSSPNTQQLLINTTLLITGKQITNTITLCERPTHRKNHNQYTRHIRVKREKELTLLFHILCIQNKTHKENQKAKGEEKKNKQKKERQTFNHIAFHLKANLWRKINTYNNTRRTNHQKRKSARIWTHRRTTLKTLSESTKHYPIFRNNIRSFFRSTRIKIRRLTSKLYNQVRRAFYTCKRKYTTNSRENYSSNPPPNQ